MRVVGVNHQTHAGRYQFHQIRARCSEVVALARVCGQPFERREHGRPLAASAKVGHQECWLLRPLRVDQRARECVDEVTWTPAAAPDLLRDDRQSSFSGPSSRFTLGTILAVTDLLNE
ncbi:hypothetical protein OG738_18010 [Amycolatopsis sp. NBC_01488]|nr:hypothetical protein [Amycolatopsis sp. NBC_01488]